VNTKYEGCRGVKTRQFTGHYGALAATLEVFTSSQSTNRHLVTYLLNYYCNSETSSLSLGKINHTTIYNTKF